MELFLIKLLVVAMIFASGKAGTKTKCDVVAVLRYFGVPDIDLRDWLCLVKHESNFHYDAKNQNRDGTTDYGIYQLNKKYCRGNWSNMEICSPCWKVNTDGCGLHYIDLLNSDIYFDTKCAVKIKNCNNKYKSGFSKWNGWKIHCRNNKAELAKSEYDYSGC